MNMYVYRSSPLIKIDFENEIEYDFNNQKIEIIPDPLETVPFSNINPPEDQQEPAILSARYLHACMSANLMFAS